MVVMQGTGGEKGGFGYGWRRGRSLGLMYGRSGRYGWGRFFVSRWSFVGFDTLFFLFVAIYDLYLYIHIL